MLEAAREDFDADGPAFGVEHTRRFLRNRGLCRATATAAANARKTAARIMAASVRCTNQTVHSAPNGEAGPRFPADTKAGFTSLPPPGKYRGPPHVRRSEHGKIPQQRQDADNDDDGLDDLLGAPVEGKAVDEIKNQNDDEKGDQDADQ